MTKNELKKLRANVEKAASDEGISVPEACTRMQSVLARTEEAAEMIEALGRIKLEAAGVETIDGMPDFDNMSTLQICEYIGKHNEVDGEEYFTDSELIAALDGGDEILIDYALELFDAHWARS